jgi:hypothetical protein
MKKNFKSGTVKQQANDQISFVIDKKYLNIEKKMVKSSSGKIILDLPDDYHVEEVKEQEINKEGHLIYIDRYKVTLNKTDDYKQGKFAVMFYPVTFDGGGDPIQDTQYHPTPKFNISYAGKDAIWGKIFNLKDL